MDSSWDNAVLKEYFSAYGEVTEVHIVTDQNGVSRNFAFVTFQSPDVARNVCDGSVDYDPVTNKRRKSTKHTIRGREVTVREADPKRARTRPSQPSAPFSPYPGTSGWFGGIPSYAAVPIPGQQDQMQQLMASYSTPQGYFPGMIHRLNVLLLIGMMMMSSPQLFYNPSGQPSQQQQQWSGYYSTQPKQ